MVYFALGIYAIGMLLIDVGRIYVSIQKRRGNPKFQNEEYVEKFIFYRRVITISMILIASVILLIFEK